MLPDTPDLETVTHGPDGLLGSMAADALLIDMSRVDPIATRRIGADFRARGVGYVDAPVSGGERSAIAGTLSIIRARLHLKDARIIERTSAELGVPTPAHQAALEGFHRLVDSDRGELDHSALFLLATEP